MKQLPTPSERFDDLLERVATLQGHVMGLTNNDKDQRRRLEDLEESEARRKQNEKWRRESWSLFFRVVLPIVMISALASATLYYRGLALGFWK